MSPLIFTTSKTDTDILGIIELQKSNLPANLASTEMSQQGFLTVIHTRDDLKN